MSSLVVPSWLFGLVTVIAGGAVGLAVAVLVQSRSRLADAAQAVTKLRREHELVLESISDDVTYLDTEMRVVWTNRTDGDHGTSCPEQPTHRGDICHRAIAGSLRPCAGCPVPEVLRSGEPAEGVVECRDGAILRLCAAPVRDRDGTVVGVVQTARDITEKRQLAERLQRLEKMEAVGQLAAGVAHDFNNSLQVMLGHGELLAGTLAADDASRSSVQAILRAGRQAREVVSRLLTFSRNREPRLQACDLGALITGQTDLLRRLVDASVDLRVEAIPPLPPVVADATQVEQVLTNLVVNARDAMPEGGTIEVRLRAVALDRREAQAMGAPAFGQFVELSVADTGTGIPPELQDRVFEPFFTTKDVDRGTGLGLSTVYGIVTAHHGYVKLASAPGRGTTFRVGLPAERTLAVRAERSSRAGGSRRAHVLLVEDDPAVRAFATKVLRDAGHTVEVAADGPAASGLLERDDVRYDAVIMDVMLPGRNGWAVYCHARRRHPDLRVVFCSGHAPSMLAAEFAGEFAGRQFLQKPYAPEELLARLGAVLAGGPPPVRGRPGRSAGVPGGEADHAASD